MFRALALSFGLAFAAAPAFSLDLNLFAQALNQQRAANGLGPVQYNPRLSQAAAIHAQDMVTHGFVSHTGSNGSSVGDRVRASGYCWRTVAENIAWNIPGETNVVSQWMGSPGHRRNMLNNRVQEFGVARMGQDYWVLVFARGGSC